MSGTGTSCPREALGRSIKDTTPCCHAQAFPSKVHLCLCSCHSGKLEKYFPKLSLQTKPAEFGTPRPRSLLGTLFYGTLQDLSPTQSSLYSSGYKISPFHRLITVLLSPWHFPPSSPFASSLPHWYQLCLSSEIF